LAVGKIGVLGGLAQRLFLGLLQRRGGAFMEARRISAVRPEHAGEERRRHLVVLGVGRLGMFGDGAAGHHAGERGVALRGLRGKPRRRARAQPPDRGANDEVGQRHAFGGADDGRDEAHVTAPFCGGNGKKALVRD
jgi:hypothetical protein